AEVANLDAYVWKVSSNVLNRTLRRKYGAVYVELTGLEQVEGSALDLLLSQEEAMLVRREVALLAPVFRSAVVRFYYEGQSVREIALAGGVSEGTVKWWLFEARNQLRKGVEMVRSSGERSFNPGRLVLGISGMEGRDGEPFTLVNGNLLAQNILLAAYEKPIDETGLAQELGVSRPYIESEARRLVAGELLKDVGGGRFQTDFIIRNSDMREEALRIAEHVYPKIRPEVVAFIEDRMPMLMQDQINVAHFPAERIRWVAVLLTMGTLQGMTSQKVAQFPRSPERPNGGQWTAIGVEYDPRPKARNPRYEYNGPMSSYFGENDGSGYGCRLLKHQFSGTEMGPETRELVAESQPVFLACIDLAKGQLGEEALCEIEKHAVADAIRLRLIKREDGRLSPNFLFMPKPDLNEFEAHCAELGERLIAPLTEMVEGVNAVVRGHSPKHVWWQAPVHSFAFSASLMPMLLDDYYKEGRLSEPAEADKELLSFYLWG
ncbi:MAG TPA: RNA polymerase sigma factor, partial [Chloroflexota bacterium]|nr:RNA polymerase sigma factor [Chloroflexota bacterium]